MNLAEKQPEDINSFIQKRITYYLCWGCFLTKGELRLHRNMNHDECQEGCVNNNDGCGCHVGHSLCYIDEHMDAQIYLKK